LWNPGTDSYCKSRCYRDPDGYAFGYAECNTECYTIG
jgi:hypothetical protein